MTDEQKTTEIKKLWIGMAEYFGITLTKNQLSMYTEDLLDLEINEIAWAVKSIRQSETFFPKPALIRQKIEGSGQDLALEAANKIVEAMVKFGYTNPDRAREFMGPVAWEIVQREGGWPALCQRTTNDDLPILKAQWRNLAAVVRTHQIKNRLELETSKPNDRLEKKE